MISFARLLLIAGVMATPCAAQTARPAATTVPPRLAAAVAGAIAELWAADSATIRLEWGSIPAAAVLSDSTPFRLSGKGGDGWLVALFQPVNKSATAVRVRAGVVDTIMLAARPLSAGSTLATHDLRPSSGVRWGIPTQVIRPAEGWVTRRALAAGDELVPGSVEAPQVVHAGDQVRIEWHRGIVTVGLDGVALASAALGETVSVRIAQRGGQRRGKVTGPGSVRLDS